MSTTRAQGVKGMANPEHVERLKQGVESWNEWRTENQGVRPDLRGINLSGADLISTCLSRAGLINIDLSGANLNGANLICADLSGANLIGVYLDGTDLSRADLSGVCK